MRKRRFSCLHTTTWCAFAFSFAVSMVEVKAEVNVDPEVEETPLLRPAKQPEEGFNYPILENEAEGGDSGGGGEGDGSEESFSLPNNLGISLLDLKPFTVDFAFDYRIDVPIDAGGLADVGGVGAMGDIAGGEGLSFGTIPPLDNENFDEDDEPLKSSVFDDEVWKAAFGTGGDSPQDTPQDAPTDADTPDSGETGDDPVFQWPDNYNFFSTIEILDNYGGTSIINTGTIDLDYRVEVVGESAVVWPKIWNKENYTYSDIDDPFYFFPLKGCDSDSDDYFSYMLAMYNIWNATDNDDEKSWYCFKAPPGKLIQSVGAATISKVIQLVHGLNEHAQWEFAGRSWIWFYASYTLVNLFIQPDAINPIVVAVRDGDSDPYYLQVRFDGLFVKLRMWNFYEPYIIDIISPILNGGPCNTIQDDADFDFFEQCNGTVTPESARLAIGDDLRKRLTGKGKGTNRRLLRNGKWSLPRSMLQSPQSHSSQLQKPQLQTRMLQANPDVYPSALKPYKMRAKTTDMKEMLENLPAFVPPMNNRPFLPVRAQGNCACCWAVASVHSISSAYAQAHDGRLFLFSFQHVMNCISLSATYPIVAGCFAGWYNLVFDWLMTHDGKLPLLSDVPYIAFQGGCYRDIEDAVDTKMKGYSQLRRQIQIKDALFYRGDVIVSLDSAPLYDWKPSPDVVLPNDSSGNPANLGIGISGSSAEGIDHNVVLIGWGPCKVSHCKNPGASLEDAECWIVQNSWGKYNGYYGYYFVHTDEECDLGISKDAAVAMIDDRMV